MHEALGGLTALTFLVWGLIRLALWIRNRSIGPMAIAIPLIEIAAILVAVPVYYGGMLVYDLGVNVINP